MAAVAAGADGLLPGVRMAGVPAGNWTALADPAHRRTAVLGLMWLLRGNDLAARASFAAVPGPVHLIRYLDAIAAVRLGDRAGAVAALGPTAAAAPGFYSAQVLMGELEAGQGRLPEALAHYRNAVAVVEDGGALMRVALIGDALDEVAVAEDALRRFIALFPDSHIGHNQLAWLFIQRETRLDEALTLAREADRLQPGNASVLDNLGWISVLQGDAAGGLPALREANRISGGGNPDIVYHLAVAEAEAGTAEAAVALLRRYMDLGTEAHASRAAATALLDRLE
jgi:predicted Zn-dependent protease